MAPRPSRVELLQGTLDGLILRTLLFGPAHGHAISKHIQLWEQSDKGKRARYYRRTASGKKLLATGQSKWESFSKAMGMVLKPADEETR